MTSEVPKEFESALAPRAKIWWERDGRYVFGHGICSILKAIEETGSIKDAAATIGKSYRHVWSRIKAVEHSLGFTLVETQVGGSQDRRSKLTDAARRLVEEFDQLRERVFEMVDQQFRDTMRSLRQRS